MHGGNPRWHIARIAIEDQLGLRARMGLEPRHAQCVDDDVARYLKPLAPADHLAAGQVDDHGQEQPALVGREFCESTCLYRTEFEPTLLNLQHPPSPASVCGAPRTSPD